MAACKFCKKQHHVCNSCGVETWYFVYCSELCMTADGRQACDGCQGYGLEHDEPGEDCGGCGFVPLRTGGQTATLG